VEVADADGTRRGGDGAQRPQDPSGHEPAEPERDDGHDPERDPVGDQQMVELGIVVGDGNSLELMDLDFELLRRRR
jgi:hypothetical protein